MTNIQTICDAALIKAKEKDREQARTQFAFKYKICPLCGGDTETTSTGYYGQNDLQICKNKTVCGKRFEKS